MEYKAAVARRSPKRTRRTALSRSAGILPALFPHGMPKNRRRMEMRWQAPRD
jgi:hypothetical protein